MEAAPQGLVYRARAALRRKRGHLPRVRDDEGLNQIAGGRLATVISYNMAEFLTSCVARYCELTG
eukprot:15460492-Alexandrium_andersonii.AAC.1